MGSLLLLLLLLLFLLLLSLLLLLLLFWSCDAQFSLYPPAWLIDVIDGLWLICLAPAEASAASPGVLMQADTLCFITALFLHRARNSCARVKFMNGRPCCWWLGHVCC